ncbi:MAG: hypothetical protein JWM39_69 [Parcubacteria group bacterium]|nr:hypothetical protein [Parcubacteria group bacterium]
MILQQLAIGAAAAVSVLGVLTYKWMPTPLLTKIQGQGNDVTEGVVDMITTLPGGAIEVGLKRGGTIDPSLQDGPIVMTGVSCTSFVHFRRGQQLPEKGTMVRAESTNRLYWLRDRSLNWVHSWKLVDSIESGVRATLVAA